MGAPTDETVDLKAWIGRTETAEDVAAAGPLQGLSALLDHETPPWRAGEAPPLAHWLYFLPRARQSLITEDGHPARGGFLPPTPLPRRMWAGSRLVFHAPIHIGARLERRSEIADVAAKTGASGNMLFVTVRHAVYADGQHAVSEDQDIVFREASTTPTPPPGPAAPHAPCDVARTVTPDAASLFRFSALTFNAHRIHYDRDYARDVEGYPGLVVHGPYLATLLMDHFLRQRPGAHVKTFAFRARRPVFDLAPFTVCLKDGPREAELWAAGPDGEACMTATLGLTDGL
ncbi:FAS1-like dehydratase domain-containing protein [Caulobacter sp. KR2-114]|uniref:FAS1-like dehydratase domain-containing protein n=1 Tax=Caulobacter sp. KR2-114 TaxID=3400912 RepID=UPI003C0996E8